MSLIPALPRSDARSLAAIGLDPATPATRRLPDGRIDFDHYLLRARQLRANSYAGALSAIGRVAARWFKAIRDQRARKRALAELLSIDDRGLRDMGLNRAGVFFAIDHGREDVPAPANVNDNSSQSPKVA
jgi:uncharacterized protein YjiS (DUF1127 family)